MGPLTVTDSSGQMRSILHSAHEMRHGEVPARPRMSQPSHTGRPFSHQSQQSAGSSTNTPDLERSFSYDSQPSSGNEGPITPPAHINTYPAHPDQSRSLLNCHGETKHILPPLRVAFPQEIMDPSSQFLQRRSSSTYSARTSLNEFNLSHKLSGPTMQESRIHPSIEHPDDIDYPAAPLGSPNSKSHPQSPREEAQVFSSTSSNAGPASKASKESAKDGPKDEKRHFCKFPDCGKSYTTSGHASRHAKTHLEAKQIPCSFPGCPKKFNRSDNMKQHLQTHLKEKNKDKMRGGTSTTSAKLRRDSKQMVRAQRRPSLASSRSSAMHHSPRESPVALSPGFGLPSPGWSSQAADLLSPRPAFESWNDTARPNLTSRTPSGLDTLAEVAANTSPRHVRCQEHLQQSRSPQQSTDQYTSQQQYCPQHYSQSPPDMRRHYPQYYPQHGTLPPRF